MAGHGHCQLVCLSGAQLSLINYSYASEEGGLRLSHVMALPLQAGVGRHREAKPFVQVSGSRKLQMVDLNQAFQALACAVNHSAVPPRLELRGFKLII